MRRNPRRSAITVASIAVGLAALTFVWAFIDGMNRQMIENSTRFLAGDLQVHLRGYHDDPSLDLTMEQVQPVMAAVRAESSVAAASVRLEGKALAAAQRVGRVEVDHGQTSCKTPDAAGYIRKTLERRGRTRPAAVVSAR